MSIKTHRTAFTALFALCAGPAMAECPTGADMTTGVRVYESNGTQSIMRDQGDGIVTLDGVLSDGRGFRTLLGRGAHVLVISDTENGVNIPGSVLTNTYAMAPADMPLPEPFAQFTFQTDVDAYGDAFTETQTQAWGGVFDYTIGDCTYDALPGKIVYSNRSRTINETVTYIIDLGFVYLNSFQMEPNPPARYAATRIEAVQ